MTREEKAKWLSEFYAQVAEGKVFEFYHLIDGWGTPSDGPDITSDPDRWRIKPKEPERLERWAKYYSSVGSWAYFESEKEAEMYNCPKSATTLCRLREVRPGDLTREEVDDVLEKLKGFVEGDDWNAWVAFDDVRRLLTEGGSDG